MGEELRSLEILWRVSLTTWPLPASCWPEVRRGLGVGSTRAGDLRQTSSWWFLIFWWFLSSPLAVACDSGLLKTQGREFPLWGSWLGICDISHSCSLDLILGLRTSICYGWGQKTKQTSNKTSGKEVPRCQAVLSV